MTTVLLDALGVLVELDPPAPRLRTALDRRGIAVSEAAAADAMRAEVRLYRSIHDRAGDRAGLDAVRVECALVVERALGLDLGPAERLAVLLEAIRFTAPPDVVPALEALRERGLALVVASNWDVSLHEVLADTGLAPLLDGAVTSAELGAAKPDRRLFAAALALTGAAPAQALHAGDDVAADVLGARAAGLRAVLVDRSGAADRTALPTDVAVVAGLDGLVALVA